MGIDVAKVDESGNVEQQVGDPRGLLSRLTAAWMVMTNSACLRFVDPYGDAVFNRYQIPILIDELRAVLRDEPDPETREHLEAVIALAEHASGEVHTYLKFIGD